MLMMTLLQTTCLNICVQNMHSYWICVAMDMSLTNLSTLYVASCDLPEPHKLVTVCVNPRACAKGLNTVKKGTLGPQEGKQSHCLPRLHPPYIHT